MEPNIWWRGQQDAPWWREVMLANAEQQARDFNSSMFSQALSSDIKRNVGAVVSAVSAPGEALRGNLGYSATDPRMMDAAANMAGVVSLGSAPMPMPVGALGMGIKMYHGSPDPRWLDRGDAFSGANPVTAPSEYMFGSPKRSVAETYAGISDMQRWKAEEGLGSPPSPNAGIRQIELVDGAKVLKVRDAVKTARDLGEEWGGVDSLERLLNAAKAQGYDAVQMTQDGGNYAILNPEAVKKVSVPR